MDGEFDFRQEFRFARVTLENWFIAGLSCVGAEKMSENKVEINDQCTKILPGRYKPRITCNSYNLVCVCSSKFQICEKNDGAP